MTTEVVESTKIDVWVDVEQTLKPESVHQYDPNIKKYFFVEKARTTFHNGRVHHFHAWGPVVGEGGWGAVFYPKLSEEGSTNNPLDGAPRWILLSVQNAFDTYDKALKK